MPINQPGEDISTVAALIDADDGAGGTRWNNVQTALDDLKGGEIVGNTTINIPADYATLAAAFAYLRTKSIERGATVTVQVADGTHDYTGAAVSLNHPQGEQIRVLGNTATPTNCVLTWTNTASGIDALAVTGGHVLGYLDGFHITRTAHAGASIGVGLLAEDGSRIICGPKVKVSNHYYGIAARMGSYIKADGAIVDGAGDVGVWAFVDSSVDCSGAVVTNTADPLQPLGFGIQAEYGSAVNCDSASASGNKIGGIAALSGSTVRAPSAMANSNTGSGLFVRDGGVIEAIGATANNNTRYGVEEMTPGRVYDGTADLTTITRTGNTIGPRAPVAVLNSDPTIGASLRASSGPLRLDTADTSSVYFNTAGGAQFEVAHVANAVNNVRARGAAAGNAVILDAAGDDASIDFSVRGKGAGTVFLGNHQTNYVRINSAGAGTSPQIRPEGEANLDLLLGGKGTGLMRFGTWTASGDAAVNGYISIKDFAGNPIKLATIA